MEELPNNHQREMERKALPITVFRPVLLLVLAWYFTGAVPAVQEDELVPGRPIVIELSEDDPLLVERGRAREVVYVAQGGFVHLHARSEELDPYLLVETLDGERLAEDENSGGGTTAFVMLEVEEGDELWITVAAGPEDPPGALTLALHELPRLDIPRRAELRLAQDEVRRSESARARSRWKAAREEAVAAIRRVLQVPEVEQSGEAMAVLWQAGHAAYDAQDPASALRAYEVVHRFQERLLPEEHPHLQSARSRHAVALLALGRTREAHEILVRVHEVRERVLPENHPRLQSVRQNLAVALERLGDLRGAVQLYEKIHEVRKQTLPQDDPQLQEARLNLAGCRRGLGDLDGALALEQQALEVLERTRRDDDPLLQIARNNLAITRTGLGDLAGALALEEKVYEVRQRVLADDHADLQAARGNLASTRFQLGDLQGAMALQEKVLEVHSRSLRDDHPALQAARSELALTKQALGDLRGALALQERVYEVCSRGPDDDDPALQGARENLALTRARLGELREARELLEETLAARARTLRPDHPALVRVRANLANVKTMQGDRLGALALQEEVLEAHSSALPADHPDLQKSRHNLARGKLDTGDLPGARSLLEEVCEVRARWQPEDHPERQMARRHLAWVCAGLGEHDRVAELLREIDRGVQKGMSRWLWTLSSRELEEYACDTRRILDDWLSLALLSEPAVLPGEGFSLVETMRASWMASRETSRCRQAVARSPAVEVLSGKLRRATTAVSREARTGNPEAFLDAVRARDETERELIRTARLVPGFLESPRVTAEQVATSLAPAEAAVSYRVYHRDEIVAGTGPRRCLGDHYLAYLVRNEGTVRRVELGPARAIDESVTRWRLSIGVPVASSDEPGRPTDLRGVESVESSPRGWQETGQALRKLVLDPLRPHLEDIQRIQVALDGTLFLVPLDALPAEEGCVGDGVEIIVRSSLRDLLISRPPPDGPPSLLAVGGLDYDEAPEPWTAVVAQGTPRGVTTALPEPPVRRPLSTGRGASLRTLPSPTRSRGFAELPASGEEAARVAATFRQAASRVTRVHLLEGRQGSRDAFEALAPQATYLHLATHAWFAPESVPCTMDPAPAGPGEIHRGPHDLRERVSGFAPMVLCGIAFAGANGAPDESGRIPAVMTAEELAALDLGSTELAVLAACETSLGRRRSSQGMASLQRALHAAGVRTAVTSLWRVPDEVTRDFMTDFYRRVWILGQPRSRALWEAKRSIRQQRAADGTPRFELRDWAGWVLSGEPD